MDHILRRALDTGVISAEDMHKLLIESPDEQMGGVIDSMHTLFCTKEHEYQVEDLDSRKRWDIFCYYYPERILDISVDSVWAQLDHKFWARYTVERLSGLNISLPGEMSDFMKALLKVGETTVQFLDRYPAARELVVRICDPERPLDR